jgi:hypothetical protein
MPKGTIELMNVVLSFIRVTMTETSESAKADKAAMKEPARKYS